MKQRNRAARRRFKGFTLIELLIVVAIIAILAAIAVPNFLEAQVRSKISRVHADMRTLSTAIEAYAVDWGQHPPARGEALRSPNPNVSPEWATFVRSQFADQQYELLSVFFLAPLTTPVSFLASLPATPFRLSGFPPKAQIKTYWYERFTHVTNELGGSSRGQAYPRYNAQWVLMSPGPLTAVFLPTGIPNALFNPKPVARDWVIGDNKFHGPYDPSNGTVSQGFIYRTNKGIYSTHPDAGQES